jgi:hypothetical protein
MTQSHAVKKFGRAHLRAIDRLLKQAYQEGFQAGLTRAHGQGRRGRTIRGDATVAGLVRIIERHFGLDRYGFEVRVVHASSGIRVPQADLLRKYRVEE